MTRPWPIVLSVPHAGLEVPEEVAALHRLTPAEIREDGDVGAAEIYLPLRGRATAFVTTSVARAFVDMNRAPGDIRKDGVVKTHTCWDVPVYRQALELSTLQSLLQRHHAPYHAALAEGARRARFGLDLHTMAAIGPPVGPDAGEERPWVCIGDAHGKAAAPDVSAKLAQAFRAELPTERVTCNAPFSGGFITRSRPGGRPWLQIELSRGPWASDEDKGRLVADAIARWLRAVSAG